MIDRKIENEKSPLGIEVVSDIVVELMDIAPCWVSWTKKLLQQCREEPLDVTPLGVEVVSDIVLEELMETAPCWVSSSTKILQQCREEPLAVTPVLTCHNPGSAGELLDDIGRVVERLCKRGLPRAAETHDAYHVQLLLLAFDFLHQQHLLKLPLGFVNAHWFDPGRVRVHSGRGGASGWIIVVVDVVINSPLMGSLQPILELLDLGCKWRADHPESMEEWCFPLTFAGVAQDPVQAVLDVVCQIAHLFH